LGLGVASDAAVAPSPSHLAPATSSTTPSNNHHHHSSKHSTKTAPARSLPRSQRALFSAKKKKHGSG